MFDFVFLSHLSWNRKLFQRPQQLALQFAKAGDTVHFFSVERLLTYLDTPLTERFVEPAPRISAMMLPQVPGSRVFPPARALTNALVRAKAYASWTGGYRVVWCQHPRFAPFARDLSPDLLVYDCMDPHGAFRNRDKLVIEQEDQLLREADVVFAGGRSLARLLEERGAKPECLPSGIDFAHFAQAAEPGPKPKELESMTPPILGYIGAIDERIDWELLRWLANERASWTFLLVGPLVGMDRIPISESNVVHVGGKNYSALPEWLRAFDVCLIPWVVDELTKHMSPTKTPEYLASGRPVVSVAIPDVEADFGADVLIGRTKEEFLAACQRALVRGKTPAVKPESSRTWEEIAGIMRARLMELGQSRELPPR